MGSINCINEKNIGIQSLASSGVINGVTITGTANQISISSNADGTAGNPTVARSATIVNSTQPCFMAYLSGNLTDVTGDGTNYTVIFDTKAFDQGTNYSTSTGNFTAPVTGLYLLTSSITLSGVLAGNSSANLRFNSSLSKAYRGLLFNPFTISVSGVVGVSFSLFVKLTAAENIASQIIVSNGTKVVDVLSGSVSSFFSGALIT